MLRSLALVLALASSACSRPPEASTQVVVRVNDDEVSIHQLRLALEKSGAGTGEASRRAALDKLVQRQLLVQQALAQKLDRRPDVMLRLEEARRDVLAAAWLEDLTARLPEPDDNAVAQFYAAHPALFARRQVYHLREVTVAREGIATDELEQRLQARPPLAELVAWMRGHNGPFTDQVALRAAEHLPVDVADRLADLRRGDYLTFATPRSLLVYQVQSADAAPMAWEAAKPVIREHLKQQQGAQALAQALQPLRASARIDEAFAR